MIQQQIVFWTDQKPDPTERKWRVDPTNPDCPFSKFIGNESAIKRLGRAGFAAMGRQNHCCSDFSFAIIGPASTGKTFLAKLFAQTVDLPFAEIQPQAVSTIDDVFEKIQSVCASEVVGDTSLELIQEANGSYVIPPMVVFIDEVHNLSRRIVQGLLKAVEHSDRTMVTEQGIEINTASICWLIATTDRGDLFDAFDTRFEKIPLRLYSKSEIAQIIQLNNPDWTLDVCEVVAGYCSHVPREALAFARDMRIEHEMNTAGWPAVASTVAEDHGIDPHGLTYQRLKILKALGQRPVPSARLPLIAQVKEDELRKYTMPPMLAVTPDQDIPLVTVTSKGYTITPSGLAALDLRGISNNGIDAMPESVRDMYRDSLPGHVPLNRMGDLN